MFCPLSGEVQSSVFALRRGTILVLVSCPFRFLPFCLRCVGEPCLSPVVLWLEKQENKKKDVVERIGRTEQQLRPSRPEEVLEVLPPDPFEQLDVARKITSIALSTCVSSLESEAFSVTSSPRRTPSSPTFSPASVPRCRPFRRSRQTHPR